MHFDLNPYDRVLIVSILTGAKNPNDCNDEEYDMLETFCEMLEQSDDAGVILKIHTV